MRLSDAAVERLVSDWIHADKVGDVASRLDIEAELDEAGIEISPGEGSVVWRRREAVS